MAEWYKLQISDWNEGTSDLTLEQEAAYLRVVNAIRQTEKPVRYDFFVLGGLWRCNERKAKRILSELVDVGKLSIDGRSIINRRAVDEASNLTRTRAERASAGSRGGFESAKSRAKGLKNNDAAKDLLEPDNTRQDKTIKKGIPSVSNAQSEISPLFGGQQKKQVPAKPKGDAAFNRMQAAGGVSDDAVRSYLEFRKTTKAKGTTERAAGMIAKQLVAIAHRGGDPDEALDMAQLQGWQGLNADWYFNKKGQDNGNGNHNNSTGNGRGMAGGTKTAEIADRASRYVDRKEAQRASGGNSGDIEF